MQANPEIERNFRSTVRGIVGPTFTDDEIGTLEDRALNTVEFDELNALRGLEAGVPVDLTAKQRAKVEQLLRRLGSDPLANRAPGAFGEGLKSGKIRVR